jgi:Flp pilus assembly protein TadG
VSRAARDERGAIAPAVPILALVVLLLGGLVLDASRQLNARGRAVAYAEEAARAGATAVDLSRPGLVLRPDEAVRRVQDFCARVAATDPVARCRPLAIEPAGATDPRPIVVHVHAEITIPATLLGIVGVRELRASGDGRARPVEGVDAGNLNP